MIDTELEPPSPERGGGDHSPGAPLGRCSREKAEVRKIPGAHQCFAGRKNLRPRSETNAQPWMCR